jgi:hypothetical protein
MALATRGIAALGFLLASSHVALAQEATHFTVPPPLPFGLRPDGNLRVDLRCADYWATPENGLSVTIDGVPATTTGTNGTNVSSVTRHGNVVTSWVATDVGYTVAAGEHHVLLAAPDCVPQEGDLIIPAVMPRFVEGRLAIARDDLRGTTGAPDGLTIGFGVGLTPVGAHTGVTTLGNAQTAYASDAAVEKGGWVATAYEHRHFVLSLDMSFGGASTSGTMREVAEPYPAQVVSGSMPFTETLFDMTGALRVGARMPLHDIAFAAGSGLGGTLRMQHATAGEGSDPFAVTPNGTDASWFLPVWASVTYKPSCTAGVQVLASYDLHPGDSQDNGVTVAAGLIYQPSSACSEGSGLRFH